jgi:hypothetical protein
MTASIREQLGLPAEASDERVAQVLGDLKRRALGNLSGPDGWLGVAEGNGKVVFERDLEALDDLSFLEDFEGSPVDYISLSRTQVGWRANVRILNKPEEPLDA